MRAFTLNGHSYQWRDDGAVVSNPESGTLLCHEPFPAFLKLKNIPPDPVTRAEFFKKLLPGFKPPLPFYLLKKETGTFYFQPASEKEPLPLFIYLVQAILEDFPLLIVLKNVTEVVYLSKQSLMVHAIDWSWDTLEARLPADYTRERLIGEVILPEFFELMSRLESFNFSRLKVFGLLSGLTGLEEFMLKRLNLTECQVMKPEDVNPPVPTLLEKPGEKGWRPSWVDLALCLVMVPLVEGNIHYRHEELKLRKAASLFKFPTEQVSKGIRFSGFLVLLENAWIPGVALNEIRLEQRDKAVIAGSCPGVGALVEFQERLKKEPGLGSVFLRSHENKEGALAFELELTRHG